MLLIYDGITVVGCNRNIDSAEQRCGKTHVAKMKFLIFNSCGKLTKNEHRTYGKR